MTKFSILKPVIHKQIIARNVNLMHSKYEIDIALSKQMDVDFMIANNMASTLTIIISLQSICEYYVRYFAEVLELRTHVKLNNRPHRKTNIEFLTEILQNEPELLKDTLAFYHELTSFRNTLVHDNFTTDFALESENEHLLEVFLAPVNPSVHTKDSLMYEKISNYIYQEQMIDLYKRLLHQLRLISSLDSFTDKELTKYWQFMNTNEIILIER